jgi:hypothetical protein
MQKRIAEMSGHNSVCGDRERNVWTDSRSWRVA